MEVIKEIIMHAVPSNDSYVTLVNNPDTRWYLYLPPVRNNSMAPAVRVYGRAAGSTQLCFHVYPDKVIVPISTVKRWRKSLYPMLNSYHEFYLNKEQAEMLRLSCLMKQV